TAVIHLASTEEGRLIVLGSNPFENEFSGHIRLEVQQGGSPRQPNAESAEQRQVPFTCESLVQRSLQRNWNGGRAQISNFGKVVQHLLWRDFERVPPSIED